MSVANGWCWGTRTWIASDRSGVQIRARGLYLGKVQYSNAFGHDGGSLFINDLSVNDLSANRMVSDSVLRLFRKRFDFNRFLGLFTLTLGVSAAVTGTVAYQWSTVAPTSFVWQSLIIAVLAASGAGWKSSEKTDNLARAPAVAGPDNDDSRDSGPPGPSSKARLMDGLEERGITIKLLELTALGDRYGNIFSLALISIDHLDDIGEHYDTRGSERMLEKVAAALALTLRMPDRVGEFGCGTYLVVLPETRLPGAIRIAERLRVAVSGLDVATSSRVYIHTTASVAVTCFRRGDDLRSLLDRLENILRAAQKQGRNRVLPDLAA
ncbi:MAG: putative diguanylate cyclase DgcQ [Gammaproteobacteria bacterium]|nr:putative diguanylate cyclase DgcQ [Gammaproteobacteria bacterium]